MTSEEAKNIITMEKFLSEIKEITQQFIDVNQALKEENSKLKVELSELKDKNNNLLKIVDDMYKTIKNFKIEFTNKLGKDFDQKLNSIKEELILKYNTSMGDLKSEITDDIMCALKAKEAKSKKTANKSITNKKTTNKLNNSGEKVKNDNKSK